MRTEIASEYPKQAEFHEKTTDYYHFFATNPFPFIFAIDFNTFPFMSGLPYNDGEKGVHPSLGTLGFDFRNEKRHAH